MRAEPFSLSAPASSANLGPGFDALAIALNLRMRASVEPSNRFSIDFEGSSEMPSHDGLERAIAAAASEAHGDLPPVRIRLRNAIPLGNGLGSSAVAAVLGAAIGFRCAGRAIRGRSIAKIACALEGHPENALAALHGGAVIAGSESGNGVLRFSCSDNLRPVLVLPAVELSTSAARALLPERYDRADVIFTAQRATLLGAALASGAWHALGEAMRDRLHQPYRAARIPGMDEALSIRARGLSGVAISGAGPAVIALIHRASAWQTIAKRIAACFERAGCSTRILPLRFSDRGLIVRAAVTEERQCA